LTYPRSAAGPCNFRNHEYEIAKAALHQRAPTKWLALLALHNEMVCRSSGKEDVQVAFWLNFLYGTAIVEQGVPRSAFRISSLLQHPLSQADRNWTAKKRDEAEKFLRQLRDGT